MGRLPEKRLATSYANGALVTHPLAGCSQPVARACAKPDTHAKFRESPRLTGHPSLERADRTPFRDANGGCPGSHFWEGEPQPQPLEAWAFGGRVRYSVEL